MVRTDSSGRYACLYKRWHLIGLEVGISVASVGLRREPTGCPTGFRADAVATAKRDLKPGETLDGEGGYTVVGKLMQAQASLRIGGLPLGLGPRREATQAGCAASRCDGPMLPSTSPATPSRCAGKWNGCSHCIRKPPR